MDANHLAELIPAANFINPHTYLLHIVEILNVAYDMAREL
jgi:hypothetical protein